MKLARLALLLLLPAAALAAKERVQARADSAVRAKPAESAAVVGQLKKGDPITIMREQGEWILISLPGNQPGWIPYRIAKERPAATATATVAAAEADTALALRECPVRKAIVVGPKDAGAKVEAVLEASKTVDVLSVKSDLPKWSIDAAVALGAPQECDVVIGLAGTRWEIVHVKEKRMLASGTAKSLEEASAMMLFELERASHETHHAPK